MITHVSPTHSENYQSIVQWSPVYLVYSHSESYISATCNTTYQHSVQWSPMFGLYLTTISTLSAQRAMINHVWSSQSDNYQRSVQWSPMFGLPNLTTISAACNDHPCLVYPIWQLSAQRAMITHVWSSQYDNYQRSMQWSPMFGLANLITSSAACNDHPCLI